MPGCTFFVTIMACQSFAYRALSGPAPWRFPLAVVYTGDSLAKQRGTNLVRVLRDSSGYWVTTEWASFQDPHRAQLVGRQCVLLNPSLEAHAP